MNAFRLTFYTRRNCTLCEKAKEAVSRLAPGVILEEVDVDLDPRLQQLYGNDVPVALHEGVEVFRHVADEEALSALAKGEWRAMAPKLSEQQCVPCRGGVPPLEKNALVELQRELGGGWRIVDEHHLEKEFFFSDFREALAFTNRVGALAEEQGHHPDIHLAWGRVRITIWTHKIDGLTRSDFVLAAKIDEL